MSHLQLQPYRRSPRPTPIVTCRMKPWCCSLSTHILLILTCWMEPLCFLCTFTIFTCTPYLISGFLCILCNTYVLLYCHLYSNYYNTLWWNSTSSLKWQLCLLTFCTCTQLVGRAKLQRSMHGIRTTWVNLDYTL